MTDAAITGITDEQLAALSGGEWIDDDGRNSPGWERWVLVEDGGEPVRQLLWPDCDGPEWRVTSDYETAQVGSFDEALRWCDDRACGFAPPVRRATKQKYRFARRG